MILIRCIFLHTTRAIVTLLSRLHPDPLLGEHAVKSPRICLETVANPLVLLHVHLVQDIHRKGFRRPWRIWRHGPWWAWGCCLTEGARRMRVDSMGTVEREQWSAYINLGSVWSAIARRNSDHKPTLLSQALLEKRTSTRSGFIRRSEKTEIGALAGSVTI